MKSTALICLLANVLAFTNFSDRPKKQNNRFAMPYCHFKQGNFISADANTDLKIDVMVAYGDTLKHDVREKWLCKGCDPA